MSQDTIIYWGMSQDLIEIHNLHLIQARTPVVDFSPFDSNNRLELTYINPLQLVSSSFFHTSSFLLFFVTISLLTLLLRTTIIFTLQFHHTTFIIRQHSSPPYPTTPITAISDNTHHRHIRQRPLPPSSVNIVIDRWNIETPGS